MAQYKSKYSGNVVNIPDGVKVDPNSYIPVSGGDTAGGGATTDNNSGMRTLYQNVFNKAQTIKDKNAISSSYKTATGEDLFGVNSGETATDKATRLKKEDAARAIDLLEKRWNEGGFAKGRIGGLLSNVLGAAGYNPGLQDYKALRESVKPMLVKAAGDTGALSLVEQEAAIKSIPTEFSTEEEAKRFFKTTREKFGIPVKQSKQKPSLEDIFK